MDKQDEVIVIGGGLAGLASALYLACDGHSVRLLERSSAVGGRAITSREANVELNLGPHALYRTGAGARVLRELGVEYSGGIADGKSAHIIAGDELYDLPSGGMSLLRNRYFSLSEKLTMSRLLTQLTFLRQDKLREQSFAEWLDSQISSARVRDFMHMFVRLSTFVNAPEQLSAPMALTQIQRALSGVFYLDHGWQTLVDGLSAQARAAGVRIETGARVQRIDHDGQVQAVRLEDGRVLAARSVVCAVGPKTLAGLVPEDRAIGDFRRRATPVLLATLDLALARLPRPERTNVQALDRPLYYAVHTSLARLASDGTALVHVAKYLAPNQTHDPNLVEAELRAFMSMLQPGYESEVRFERFLPALVVHNALPMPLMAATRFPVVHPTIEGLYCVGDWVSNHGLLADAALGSAREAMLAMRTSGAGVRAA